MMKKLLISIALLAALVIPAAAQTNSSSVPILDTLTSGSNWFAVPFATVATGDRTFGGGLAIGYKATSALAPVLRLDEFAGKAYLANLSLELSVPRKLMGKVPIVPFIVAGAGIPLSSATIDGNLTISAGQPVGIVGIGAYMPFDWAGSSWMAQNTFAVVDYEHWTGAGIPSAQQNQIRFGFGVSF